MNPARVRKRELATVGEPQPARLLNFRLVFNKISRVAKGAASANIEKHFGGSVDGVLYELESSSAIESMDVFESAPRDYSREVVYVRTINPLNQELAQEFTPTWTYIGQPSALADGLKPTKEYLGHLLANPFIQPSQRTELSRIVCLDQ